MIEGLNIREDFIDEDEENNLIQLINLNNWNNQISRQTQHYGYRYDYKTKRLYDDVPQIPEWIHSLINKIDFPLCDQVIINKYEEGQGISPHIDHKKLFDDDIYVLSLGEDVEYKMTGFENKKRITKTIPVKRRSLIHMCGEARYLWTHSLKMKKNSKTRYSFTLRELRYDF